MKPHYRVAALTAALLLLLGGCSFYSGDDLLLAPQPTRNFVALQVQLRKILDGGALYAVPQSGRNRSTIQLVDFDNDGTDEAIAFFRDSSTASTFTVYVFKKIEDDYVLLDSVTGQGLSVQAVEYPVFSRDGEKGLLITWGLEDGQTSALTLCDFSPGSGIRTLLQTDFTNYRLSDLTGDGTDELFTISGDGAKGRTAVLYGYQDGRVSELGRASVSQEAVSIVRLTAGWLEDGAAAVFAEARPDSGTGLLTDIFVYGGGQLRNITQNTESGASGGSYRAMSVYATDIDGDHITEVPQTVLMEGFGDPNEPDALYLLDWYAFASDGTPKLKRTTYHNVSEEWSFRLPEGWRSRVTASKETLGGVSRTTFCEYVEGGDNPTIFSVYCCTGDQRDRYAMREDLVALAETANAYYAGEIPPAAGELSLSAEELSSRFSVLTTEWAN
ncbi:hypothetical protein D7X33_13130 [Butyricicoccus sp. 1XD8-22]|nr:hypothetical protein D7X33_13130 [Butyricicoccus sp. 1XD8-22]